MLPTSSLITLGSLVLPAAVSAASWTLTDYYDPQSFLSDEWNFFSEADPTNGLVTYQGREDAIALNLSYINSNNEFVMRVDTTEEQLSGRPSVRIFSEKNFTDGVYILNATHSPSGCSVWPAWWTVTSEIDEWPAGGEIDIMENSNNQFLANLAAVHTESSCIVSDTNMTGTLAYNDCSADTGCRVEMNGTDAVAATTDEFNSAGGGIYAMERSFGSTGQGIRVWYFDFDNIPENLRDNSTEIDTDAWGVPGADFPITSCASQFSPHRITFTITLCGDWAGPTYNDTSCAATYGACSAQVAYNGSSYSDAYWAINAIKVYASGGGSDAAPAATNSASTPDPTSTGDSGSGGGSSGSSRSATLSSVMVVLLGSIAAWTLLG